MKKIGILYHPMNKAAYPMAEELKGFLSAAGFSVWTCSSWEGDEAKCRLDGSDLIVTVGGDGTILRAAQIVATDAIPVIGVNLGRLGFMTELKADEAKDKLKALLSGKGWIDERAMLEVEVSSPDVGPLPVIYALNEAVVARGNIVRMICVEVAINGKSLATYKADGVIVATATGSTGYALSAGGPVLHPNAEECLLLPILPHLRSTYPLVLPAGSVLELRVDALYKAISSIDGHINTPLENGSRLVIKKSAHKLRFLRFHGKGSFYGSLEQKLKGKR